MIAEIVRIAKTLDGEEILNWFVFGSYLRSPFEANDLDILVIYSNPLTPKIVRLRLDEVRYPIDPIFMTREEENQFDFVKNERAVQIYPAE